MTDKSDFYYELISMEEFHLKLVALCTIGLIYLQAVLYSHKRFNYNENFIENKIQVL